MKLRADGRAYSLVTRRSVAILKSVPKTSADRASLITKLTSAAMPELYLARFKRNISEDRLLDYLQFHAKLEVLEFSGDNVRLHPDFVVPTNDAQWINALADQAKGLLGQYLRGHSKPVDERIASTLKTIHTSGVSPTPGTLADRQKFGTNKEKEQFRWALYLYLDGEACPFQLRRKDTLEQPGRSKP